MKRRGQLRTAGGPRCAVEQTSRNILAVPAEDVLIVSFTGFVPVWEELRSALRTPSTSEGRARATLNPFELLPQFRLGTDGQARRRFIEGLCARQFPSTRQVWASKNPVRRRTITESRPYLRLLLRPVGIPHFPITCCTGGRGHSSPQDRRPILKRRMSSGSRCCAGWCGVARASTRAVWTSSPARASLGPVSTRCLSWRNPPKLARYEMHHHSRSWDRGWSSR